ncbi:MAG TPA: alcohol dehydrogenase catalytic domain-containing protein, partial [bacterium]|nr:alcohol dehydrogenase catalytic domain-containing protein [bacterium]
MKAALFDGSSKLKIIDRKKPKIEKDQVLIKVAACGICGTDVKILAGQSHSNPPVVLGHEFCGEIVEIGAEVDDLIKGDFVSVDPNIYCGRCKFCRRGQVNLCENLTAIGVDIDGGFEEYCAVPSGQCYSLNKKPIQNATLMEPLSCSLFGIKKANIELGDNVAIVGSGMIGIMMIKLSQLKGASRII